MSSGLVYYFEVCCVYHFLSDLAYPGSQSHPSNMRLYFGITTSCLRNTVSFLRITKCVSHILPFKLYHMPNSSLSGM